MLYGDIGKNMNYNGPKVISDCLREIRLYAGTSDESQATSFKQIFLKKFARI
jgi:hypothetical protein